MKKFGKAPMIQTALSGQRTTKIPHMARMTPIAQYPAAIAMLRRDGRSSLMPGDSTPGGVGAGRANQTLRRNVKTATSRPLLKLDHSGFREFVIEIEICY